MALQVELLDEKTAPREELVETKYLGKNSLITGKEGEAFCNTKSGQWYFRLVGEEDWFRVDGKNLSCNQENGWLNAKYKGLNKVIADKDGKVMFSEEQNSWIFKPKGGKKDDLFRVGEKSLTFLRDVDLTDDSEGVE